MLVTKFIVQNILPNISLEILYHIQLKMTKFNIYYITAGPLAKFILNFCSCVRQSSVQMVPSRIKKKTSAAQSLNTQPPPLSDNYPAMLQTCPLPSSSLCPWSSPSSSCTPC